LSKVEETKEVLMIQQEMGGKERETENVNYSSMEPDQEEKQGIGK
jgi:hypothetical protein